MIRSCGSMKNATNDVVEPDPGVKNEEHVAREKRDREKWPEDGA